MSATYIRLNVASGGGSDDRRLKVSIDDQNAAFLEEKTVAGSTKVVLTVDDPGNQELLNIDIDQTQIDHDQLLNFEVDEHRPLDDASTTTTSLWSSDKIQTELDGKVNAIPNPVSDNKLLKSIGLDGINVEQTNIDVDDSSNVTGINNLTIAGDLTVNGTTTSVNTDTLDVEDANITVNKNGNQSSADLQNAGLTVEMSDATDVELGYDSTTTSKFKIGEVGDSREVLTVSHTQAMSNKSIDADLNTLSNIETDNFKAGVVETDLNSATDNTKLAGAQSIKDYVAQEIATKDEASEITYDNTTSGLAATDVQAAIDETEGRLDTAETSLAAHLNTDPAKHDGDQITYNGTSSLSATNVEAAIDELDSEKYNAADYNTDFDTRLASKSTTDLSEGTNLYFTDERARQATGTSENDIGEGSTALSESASGSAVTGLTFANADVTSFEAHVTVEIDATSDIYEKFTLNAVQINGDWQVSVSSVGDDTSVEFDVNSTGQVIYNSSTYTGFVAGAIKFRATTLGR